MVCTDGDANLTQGVVMALCYAGKWYTVNNSVDGSSQLSGRSTTVTTILGALLGLMILVALSLAIISVSVWIMWRHKKEDRVIDNNSVLE